MQSGSCQGYTAVGVNSACGEFDGASTPTTIPVLDVKLCLDSYCKYPSATDVVGTCIALPSVGQPCDAAVGCAGMNPCIGGTCLAASTLTCN